MNISQTPDLPTLTDDSIERMEQTIFTTIESGRAIPAAGRPPRRRPRRWLSAVGIAAAFVAGVLVTPPILNIVGGSGGTVTADGVSAPFPQSPIEMVAENAVRDMNGSGSDGSVFDSAEAPPGERELITTATATVQVEDVPAAVAELASIADRFGGWVESTSTGQGGLPVEPTDRTTADPSFGWVSIRVPADDLTEVTGLLEDLGEVRASSINTQDVTTAAIDLRARVEATRASVERLTELMTQSGSVSELIEAEIALTDRQAQLESYEQQLANLEGQVAMSSLHVELTREAIAADPDPAGFADGLLAGWNGLIVSLNALVIATGFLLPWLGVAAIIALLVWLVVRRRRARRQPIHE